MMIRIAKAIGFATSRAASSMTRVRLIGCPTPACGQQAEAVLHHDHRAVDHHADADGQPASDIRLAESPTLLHQDESDQHRQAAAPR